MRHLIGGIDKGILWNSLSYFLYEITNLSFYSKVIILIPSIKNEVAEEAEYPIASTTSLIHFAAINYHMYKLH